MKILNILLVLLLSLGVADAGTTVIKKKAVAASGGEVGNKSGANDDTSTPATYPGADQSLTSCFAAGTSGTIGYIHVHLASSPSTGHQYNAGIYNSSGGLIADGTLREEPGTVPGIMTFALDSATTITASTTYCLSVGDKSPSDSWSVSSTSAGTIYTDATFDVENTLPATADVTTVRQSGYTLRIWATNTSDGS